MNASSKKCLSDLLVAVSGLLASGGWRGPDKEQIGSNTVVFWLADGGWSSHRIEMAYKSARPSVVTITLLVLGSVEGEEVLVDDRDLGWLAGRGEGYRLPQLLTSLRCAGLKNQLIQDLEECMGKYFEGYLSVEAAKRAINAGETIHGTPLLGAM